MNLEDIDLRNTAINDPRGFLNNFPRGAVLDEVQRIPELFLYIQGIVDESKEIHFVLSGSQNFLLLESISQSLACSLLGINSSDQVRTYHSKGALFENLIITELIKSRLHHGVNPRFYFWQKITEHYVD